MANKLLYSTGNKLLYSADNKLVFGDLIFSDDYIYITFEGLWYASDPANAEAASYYYESHLWSMGYDTTPTGLYYGGLVTDTDEKASMEYWLPTNSAYARETSQSYAGKFTARFNFSDMVDNAYGKGNDGTNDYYEIIIFCDQFNPAYFIGDDGDYSMANNYCKIRAWKDLDTISDTYSIPNRSSDDITFPRTDFTTDHPETELCRIRWTPETSTLEFID